MKKLTIIGLVLLIVGFGLYILTEDSGYDTLYGILAGVGFGLALIGFGKKKKKAD